MEFSWYVILRSLVLWRQVDLVHFWAAPANRVHPQFAIEHALTLLRSSSIQPWIKTVKWVKSYGLHCRGICKFPCRNSHRFLYIQAPAILNGAARHGVLEWLDVDLLWVSRIIMIMAPNCLRATSQCDDWFRWVLDRNVTIYRTNLRLSLSLLRFPHQIVTISLG